MSTDGMVFLGCSFTFGHGLWHYTKEEGLPKDDICISPKDFPNAYTFMKNNRFSKIVSNHFGKFDIVKSHTAGCDEVSLEFLSEILGLNTWQRKYTMDESFDFNQISHVIFQTSYLDRCALYENGKKMKIYDSQTIWKERGKIIKEVESFWDELKHFYYNKIKEMFYFLEEKNIKCYMIAMDYEYQDLIEKDESMMKRFIEIEYDGKTFNNFRSLSEYNKKLIICNDTDFFDKPPKDLHPGLEWQRIVASSIIKKLETDLS
jgi:hypothetical protein